MRLFIALELPEPVLAALATTQQQLRRTGDHPVKWVAPESVHLTLQFLGEVGEERVPALLAALEQAQHALSSNRSAVPTLHLAAAGAFPNIKRPQTIWVGVGGDTAPLAQLQQAVVRELEPLGFAAEDRPFRAHLTIGRVQRTASSRQRSALGSALADLPKPRAVRWPMGTPMLFQSTLTPAGSIYKRISHAHV
jgi:2'-5' RNA ligase